MENKNKDKKHSSSKPQSIQDKDKAEQNMTLGNGSRLHDNVPSSNQQQQQPSMFQWPYNTQNATQAPWQQLPHPQQGNHLFWRPQLFGWQANPVVPQATSATTQNLVPNMHYSDGYTFPSFSGPWDPSFNLAQMHQLQHSSSNLAQMHQLQHSYVANSAEAHSTENAKLWSMVNKLQAEVSDYKARLTILEQEVSSLKKHKVEKPTNEIARTIPPVAAGQPRKRGRPSKQSSISIDALREAALFAHSRKPALSKPQFESKSPIFKKIILKKVENKEIPVHKYVGNTGGTPFQDSGRHVLHATHQQGGNITPERNFANEKDVSEEEEDDTLGSAEDENEDEMVDDED